MACQCACHDDAQVCESDEWDELPRIVTNACPCHHIQISLEQTPTITSSSNSTMVGNPISLLVLPLGDLSPGQGVLQLSDHRTRPERSPVPAPRLTALASVVLLC
jgi:hypothetical protein